MCDATGLVGLEFAMEKSLASNAEVDGATYNGFTTNGCV
jgi:hypothetical protein